MSSDLQLPQIKTHDLEDPGAHELESSDGSEDFVDASEGQRPSTRTGDQSPIPVTRVERVDDEPAYGEVPGTTAYKLRTADAVPDEIEVVPEGTRSRSASRVSRPSTPGGTQIPKIIAEKIDPDTPAYGDVPGTAAFEMRKADATPDEIIKSPASDAAPANPFRGMSAHPSPLVFSERLTGQASPTASNDRLEADDDETLDRDSIHLDGNDDPGGGGDDDDGDDGEEEGFGDDFDDFAEGEEADADDDDFGDFDEGFASQPEPPAQTQQPAPSQQQPSIPIPDFTTSDDLPAIHQTCTPYLRALFPSYTPSFDTASSLPAPSQQIFLSERSISLYTQLIAPPPLAPPNWLRSRIRRLFLVSLGVPVDLDEILPASKQKKLVLPSGLLKAGGGGGERKSTSAEARDPLGKLKVSGNDSDASGTSSASRSKSRSTKTSKSKTTEAVPVFDTAAARRLASTTRERIDGMEDEELKMHVKMLEEAGERGREYLGYWGRRVEEARREKEAFEGVIENLVSFARKSRK